MNTNNRRWIALSVLALILPGCLEKYEVKTVVAPDGTCDRVVSVFRDSKDLPKSAFPIPVDSTWKTTWETKEKSDSGHSGKTYVYTASKHFDAFETLEREYSGQRDSADLTINVKVERRFRWFYTYFEYSETYARFNPLRNSVQPTEYMSSEDIQRFLSTPEPDSLLQTQWKKWDDRNMAEWMFSRLCDAVQKRNDQSLPVSLFQANKAKICSMFMDDSDRTPHKRQSFEERFAERLSVLLNAPTARLLSGDVARIGEEVMKRIDVANRAEGTYKNSVTLPGMIVSTNANEVQGTTITWQFTHEHLALADFPMVAESRVVNLWAIILTGVVVLAVIVVPVFLRKRW